jgi:tetratricopeptide (TPR) repeat protein
MNMKGQVVGVATMSLGGQDAQNLNFAVPAGTVQGILAKAAQAKPVPLASAGGRPLEQDGAREFLAAMQAIDEERWSDAVRIVQGLRQSEPSNPLVFFILGVLHFELGNQDLALETFREGVRLAPEEPITHVGLGVVLQRMGRHADSVASFRAAIRLSPDYWPAYQGLGVSQYHLGQYRESAATLRTAVRLEPEAENAWYFLGLDYVALRDHGAALSCYRALRYLDPGLAADLAKQIPGP